MDLKASNKCCDYNVTILCSIFTCINRTEPKIILILFCTTEIYVLKFFISVHFRIPFNTFAIDNRAWENNEKVIKQNNYDNSLPKTTYSISNQKYKTYWIDLTAVWLILMSLYVPWLLDFPDFKDKLIGTLRVETLFVISLLWNIRCFYGIKSNQWQEFYQT